jgi:uncharacterized protein YndB with AHSA1/START domain
MRPIIPALVLVISTMLVAPASAKTTATFDRGAVHVVTSDDPKRIDWDVVVSASLDAVWDAFTTQAGLTSWIAPGATVDLRSGGDWLALFPGAAPGGGTIVVYQPKTLLVIRAMAPEKFPTVRRERTLAVFTFSAQSAGATEVHLAQTGWQDGDEWTAAYAYLTNGNAQLLGLLYQRFTKGPIDWSKM